MMEDPNFAQKSGWKQQQKGDEGKFAIPQISAPEIDHVTYIQRHDKQQTTQSAGCLNTSIQPELYWGAATAKSNASRRSVHF